MGGRGSGGGRSSGGGKSSSTKLNKQIDNVSKKVVTLKEFETNYKFYDSLNNADLTEAQKITRKKFLKESEKYAKMQGEHENRSYNIPTQKDNKFRYDTTSKEWKDYKKSEKAIGKQLLKVDSLQRSLKQVNMIMDKRGLKY